MLAPPRHDHLHDARHPQLLLPAKAHADEAQHAELGREVHLLRVEREPERAARRPRDVHEREVVQVRQQVHAVADLALRDHVRVDVEGRDRREGRALEQAGEVQPPVGEVVVDVVVRGGGGAVV